MNPDRAGGYLNHLRNNLKYAWRLGASGAAFLLHALIPAWKIPGRHDLLQMGIWIHIEVMKQDVDEEPDDSVERIPTYRWESDSSDPIGGKIIPWR